MEITNITTARILEDAIRHLADARLARDPLTRLISVVRVQRELADVLSRMVSDLVNHEEPVGSGRTNSDDAA